MRRAPHGARGLKFLSEKAAAEKAGRAPHGARGLKYGLVPAHGYALRRAPHGARGLKSANLWAVADGNAAVAPRMGRVD